MKKPLIAFAIICSCFASAYAQESTAGKISPELYKWAIKLPLLNIIDIVSPNLVVGVECRLDARNGIQVAAGPSINPVNSNFNGFRLKGEYRRYYHVRSHFAFFVAGEPFYTRYTLNKGDSFASQQTGTNYWDNYHLLKQAYGFNGKWGFQVLARKHFTFETYVGLGFKYRVITAIDRSHPVDPFAPMRHAYLDIPITADEPGTGVTLSAPVNIAIGYRF